MTFFGLLVAQAQKWTCNRLWSHCRSIGAKRTASARTVIVSFYSTNIIHISGFGNAMDIRELTKPDCTYLGLAVWYWLKGLWGTSRPPFHYLKMERINQFLLCFWLNKEWNRKMKALRGEVLISMSKSSEALMMRAAWVLGDPSALLSSSIPASAPVAVVSGSMAAIRIPNLMDPPNNAASLAKGSLGFCSCLAFSMLRSRRAQRIAVVFRWSIDRSYQNPSWHIYSDR